MRTIAALLGMSLLIAADEKKSGTGAFRPDPTARIVMHEWGVIASYAGADRRLIGASGPADSDLPSFITQLPTLGQSGGVVARQPIVYFYSDKPTDFSARVNFGSGYPICFDPPAREWSNSADWKNPGRGYLGWQGRLDPASQLKPPQVADDHWISRCREVDATPVLIGSRMEKYLFYEGVVDVTCPVSLEADGDAVRAKGISRRPTFAIRVRNGKVETYPVKGEGALEAAPVSIDALLKEAGLYEKESAALLSIWRDHFFKREGLRLVTLITGDEYDALLPIAVCPKPVESKRVLLLCVDFPTAEIEAAVNRLIPGLESEQIDERERTCSEILALGPIAAAAVAKHQGHSDPEVRARIQSLIEKLKAGVPVPKQGAVRLRER